MNFFTVFKESSGEWSMRRFLAFLFGFAGLVIAILCIIFLSDWKVCAVVVGIPFIACLILLLFTTWEDITGIVSAVKGKENK